MPIAPALLLLTALRAAAAQAPREDLVALARESTAAIENTWSVEEVDFATDVGDLKQRMTDAERHLVQRLVAFFATGDFIVANNLVLNLYRHFNAPAPSAVRTRRASWLTGLGATRRRLAWCPLHAHAALASLARVALLVAAAAVPRVGREVRA
jgi:hypothetical protein